MGIWFIFPALALIAGIVALTPLGTQVLKRGVVFIDLAVAQAAAAAVIWLNFALDVDSPFIDQVAATSGAVVVGLVVAWVARKWSQQREALIGLIYVAGACMALLGASQHPHGREKLFHLLAADVLWVDSFSVGALLAAALAVLAIRRKHWLAKDAFFYAVFAVIASVAVPALGLFLVFASLIAPALWIERGLKPWTAMVAASVFCMIGLFISWVVDTPSGPTVVMTLAVFGVCALFRRQPEDSESEDLRSS
jgi:zinc/manganese transport system permease protein